MDLGIIDRKAKKCAVSPNWPSEAKRKEKEKRIRPQRKGGHKKRKRKEGKKRERQRCVCDIGNEFFNFQLERTPLFIFNR